MINNEEADALHNFYTSLITFEGTRYDWQKLVLPVNAVLEKKQSPNALIVSGDQHSLSEISGLEVVAHQFYMPFLIAKWVRHMGGADKNKAVGLRGLKYWWKFCHRAARAVLGSRQQKMLKRQALRALNISASHLQGFSAGVQSNARFVVTLEDDGLLALETTLETALDFILESCSPGAEAFFDISESFSFEQLGADHIVAESERFRLGQTDQTVVKVRIPFPNTLCATVMSRELVKSWCAYLKKSLASKVVRLTPIDWLLNRFILSQDFPPQSAFFHFDPGVVRQLSLNR